MSTPPHLRLPEGARPLRLPVIGGSLAAVEATPRGEIRATAVLVPGITGSKEDFIAVLGALVEAGYRVVSIDQRGQHESDHAPERAGYDLPSLGADVLSVVEQLRDGPVHLLGHSFGGLVAREAALARPASFRSLTLLDSGPAAVPGPSAERLRLLVQVVSVLELDVIWGAMRQLDAEAGVPLPPAEVEEFLRRRFLGNDPACLGRIAEHLLTAPDRTAELAASNLPVHVVYGESDDAWPPEVQSDMAARLGAAESVVAGAGHSPAAEQPDATSKALTAFWRQVEAAQPPGNA